jgi:hypothetical protein
MCRRYLRVLLLITGCLLLFIGVFPVLAFLHLGELMQTALMASKLLMLPTGAICLVAAERLHVQQH